MSIFPEIRAIFAAALHQCGRFSGVVVKRFADGRRACGWVAEKFSSQSHANSLTQRRGNTHSDLDFL